jgi:tetratricopeptide (TPR) repeat protein
MPAHDPDDRARRAARTVAGDATASTGAPHASTDANHTLPAPPDQPPAAGPAVPGFDVRGELARGGMGVVLAATDRALGRAVAIKTLRPDVTDPTALRRFTDEARITAGLAHPGIPPIHQVGTLADGRPFLAMKLIQGKTLAALLADAGRADAADLLPVFEYVCQAVGFAHSRGIIHRDLKPLNIMVGAFGEVQVMDWGLAKESRGADAGAETDAGGGTEPSDSYFETQFGRAMGTPQYMPPEQARGEWDVVTERSDVFALGGILAAILTGKPPHEGATARAVLRSARAGDLAACFARLDACGADPELIALAKRCLSPEPADRPADAAEVARLVAAHRAGVQARLAAAETARAAAAARAEEAHHRAEAEAAKAREQRRRRRTQLGLVCALALLVLGGGAFAWHADRAAEQKRFEAARAADEARARGGRNAEALDRLLAECEAALRDDDSPAAEAVLREAERRIAEDGAEPLRPRLARCRADFDLLTELDRLDEGRWTEADGRTPPRAQNAAAWAAFFRRHGIIPGETDRAAAVRFVNESLVRERLLAALDEWFAAAPASPLLELVQAADPDPFRDAVRLAITADLRLFVRLIALQPALAGQPPRTHILLAGHRLLPIPVCDRILTAAHRRAPRHLPVLMALSTLHRADNPQTAQRRAGWCRTALALRPTNTTLWNNLGWALRDADEPGDAIAAFREALRLDPRQYHTHHGLGLALMDADNYPEGLIAAERAIELRPDFANPYNARGVALRRTGRLEEAVASYTRSIELDPEFDKPRINLARALAQLGRFDEAVAAYRGWLALEPRDADDLLDIGTDLERWGDYDGARAAYRLAVRRAPGRADGYNATAWLLATCPDARFRDGRGAVAAGLEACRLGGWRDANHIDTLAAAYAEAGDFDRAVEAERRALSFPNFAQSAGAGARARLEMYARKQPFHKPAPRDPPPKTPVAPPPRPAG